MEIDLTKVLAYSKDCLQNRAQMRSIMMDMYPGMTRDMNILLDVYESGVPRKIQNDGSITDTQYAQYVQKIVNEYGMQEQHAVIGLNAWIDVCLGEGTSATIKYNVSVTTTNDAGSSNRNAVVGHHIHPKTHRKNTPVNGVPSMETIGDYKITVLSNRNVEITKYVGSDQANIVIPNEINGKKVLGVGERAFYQCKEIQQVIIPEGVEYLKAGAFAECSILKKIILPTTLDDIGEIKGRRGLYDLDYYPRANIKGIFAGTAIHEIDLPNCITGIPENCFSGCKELEKVQFSKKLKLIAYGAFANCKKITEIQLPTSVRMIKENAFSGCEKLTNVELNKGLRTIGDGAFEDCSAITDIKLPPSVYWVGKRAFSRCTKLVNVELNEGLEVIDDRAFEYCKGIKEITIPRSVERFGEDIFKCGRGRNKNILLKCYAGGKHRARDYAEKNNLEYESIWWQ